jgi:hypothetical protein
MGKETWTSHVQGAVTLVKLRGRSQFTNPFSRKVFRAVRSLMFIASLTRGTPIESFSDEQGWGCDDEYEMNNANRLTLISLEIPDINSCLPKLIGQEKTSSTIMEIMALIQRAQDIDTRLEDWAHSLPVAWNATVKKVVTEEPANVYTEFFWPGPVYTYQDANIANVLNDYRIARILCQSVILQCVKVLTANSQSDTLSQMYTRAVYATRRMTDEVCSTIPFLLGFDIENTPEGMSESMARGRFYHGKHTSH